MDDDKDWERVKSLLYPRAVLIYNTVEWRGRIEKKSTESGGTGTMNDQSAKLQRRMTDKEQESVDTDLGQNENYAGLTVTVQLE